MIKIKLQKYLDEIAKFVEKTDETKKAVSVLKEAITFCTIKVSSNEEILTGDFELPKEIVETKNFYALFSDGACRGNPGPGAWAMMAQDDSKEIIFFSSEVSEITTNNQMELLGAIKALESLIDFLKVKDSVGVAVYLFSDSKYVIDGVSKWLPSWKNRGWKKADNKAPENLDLWQRMDCLIEKFEKIKFFWVKGHAGHTQNEFCDKEANKALDSAGY